MARAQNCFSRYDVERFAFASVEQVIRKQVQMRCKVARFLDAYARNART
jgi:hypothetical protein